MKTTSKITIAAAIAASLAGAAFAQDDVQTDCGHFGHHGPGAMHGQRGERLEQHLAQVKSQLKITPQQEPAWNAFTTAVTSQMKSMPRGPQAREEMAALSAPERAQRFAQRMQERAQGAQTIAQAVKTLYGQLTPEQQQTADHLMMGRHKG